MIYQHDTIYLHKLKNRNTKYLMKPQFDYIDKIKIEYVIDART